MLILTRSPGQRLTLGDDIVVEVLGVTGRQVKLGLTAPKDIPILREELTEREANTEAPNTSSHESTP